MSEASQTGLASDQAIPFLAQESSEIYTSQDTTEESFELTESDVEELLSGVASRLFISHFLSTWNSRVFEFGAVLYLASIFPQTLMPMSIYALTRGASAILFSSTLGRYVDRGNRLQVVRLSIGESKPHVWDSAHAFRVLQRLAVAASCAIFWILAATAFVYPSLKIWVLVPLALLACVEKLCSILNLISVERDWVVVIAENNDEKLRLLNSKMRRIDLMCKLAGPFTIAIIDGISTEVAIIVNFAMNLLSVGVEYWAIARVYQAVPGLRKLKQSATSNRTASATQIQASTWWQRLSQTTSARLNDLAFYTRHSAFLPSFAGSLLYLTVLSFSGQMITYLLSFGYTSLHIGIARTISVTFEISATWLAPFLMTRIGPIRAGIWFLNWQILCLAAAAAVFWGTDAEKWAAAGLVAGTIASRVGLWGFDLCAQIIVQEEVEPDRRGAFSSTEAAWQNAFELCSFAATIAFSKPEQFQWPVLMSCAAVAVAGAVYAVFVRSRRGHLLHVSRFIEPKQGRPASARYALVGTSDF